MLRVIERIPGRGTTELAELAYKADRISFVQALVARCFHFETNLQYLPSHTQIAFIIALPILHSTMT